jgi:preprotein translocase subunit SecD
LAAAVKYRPGRFLLAILIVLIGLYLGVFLGPSKTPALGLDLRGGTQVTLTAQPLEGGKITKSALNQAVNIITNRVDALGVAGASVNTQGSKNIVVAVPGKGHDQVVQRVGQTALLRFRQVLEYGAYQPTALDTTSPTPTAKATATAKSTKKASSKKASSKESASPTASSSTKSQGDVANSALLKSTQVKSSGAKAKASTSPSPSTTPTTSTSPSTTPTASASPSASALPADTSGPSVGSSGVTDAPLPGSESKTLTAAFTKSFADWNCRKNPNPTNGNDIPSDYIIACDDPTISTAAKYLLAPASVEGTDVSTASAGLDQTGVNWVVNIQFNSAGASKWLAITKKTYEVNSGQSSTSCTPPTGCNAIGITLDGQVQSAPYTETDGIPGGQSQISGNFSQKDATNLADILKYGALPLKFTESDVQTVSATLGSRQLHGGLVAGAIGLGLVILFSLIYYRALGLVTVGSLAVSGLILYAVTTLLGHSSVGYTLSLPGIAGFIVAVGITADSFVVYFERLRDEIREGRRLRSAVERAWPRARRTILSADTVSLLAALILYAVSIGDVRGFAFTLGMSTLSDLFIVWFFTRPLLTLLGRRPAFDSGKSWTGIGRPRAGVAQDADADGPSTRRRPRTGEVSG